MQNRTRSHLAWGAWIEITSTPKRRTTIVSHLAWGAWIEIFTICFEIVIKMSHLAWGAWIEIFEICEVFNIEARRTSHGVRGLKYYQKQQIYY